MGKTEVEWSLQLKEIHELSKNLKTFSFRDLLNMSNQSQREVRRNISILLSLGIIKSINTSKNIYRFNVK